MKFNLSGTLNRISTGTGRKRKDSPVSLVLASPDLKKKSTPLAGKNIAGSGNINKSKINVITNHFQSYSSARQTGGGGQTESEAVDVLGQGDGGGGMAVQGALARTVSGLKGGDRGGEPEQIVSAATIGPDQSAGDILANTGQDNIQLNVHKIQRGNGKKNSRK